MLKDKLLLLAEKNVFYNVSKVDGGYRIPIYGTCNFIYITSSSIDFNGFISEDLSIKDYDNFTYKLKNYYESEIDKMLEKY